MLRGLARQLTSLSALAEARLGNGVLQGGTAMHCLAPASCAAARLYSSSSSNQQLKSLIYNRGPEPLEFLRPHWAPAPGVEESLLKRTMLRVFGFYSREATYMRAAQGLYDSITELIDDKRLMQALELPDDFQHMHGLLSLHVWLLLGRLRAEGKSGKQLGQQLYDNFQDDVEKRVRAAGVKVRLHKQLVELEKQFYGSCFAYDKALKGEGSEDFPAALHRNVFQKAEGSKDAAAMLARYVKREMACLALTDSTALFAGNLRLSAMRLLLPEGGTPAEPPAADVSAASGLENSNSAAAAAAST